MIKKVFFELCLNKKNLGKFTVRRENRSTLMGYCFFDRNNQEFLFSYWPIFQVVVSEYWEYHKIWAINDMYQNLRNL